MLVVSFVVLIPKRISPTLPGFCIPWPFLAQSNRQAIAPLIALLCVGVTGQRIIRSTGILYPIVSGLLSKRSKPDYARQ
jgi:hypothetical protein